jgi:hypothetical protein
MDEFNYLAVLISIILGLGIAQLLAGFARWVEHRTAFRAYAPALIWAAVLLVTHVQTWWSMFGLRDLAEWTFLRFAIVLLQPITLYMLATLVLPGSTAPSADPRTNYYHQRRWFFGLLAFLLVVSVVKDLIVSGALPDARNLGFHAVFLASAIVAIATSRHGYHLAIAIVAAAAIGAYVGLLFWQLR